jgi:hypothetical protein
MSTKVLWLSESGESFLHSMPCFLFPPILSSKHFPFRQTCFYIKPVKYLQQEIKANSLGQLLFWGEHKFLPW